MDVAALTPFHAPISQEIWEKKYRFEDPFTGDIHDKTVEDTWERIARALAQPEDESEREFWAGRFYDTLSDFKFLPAGRIIAGAGTGRNVTLFNCYVMGTIPDSMDGIFDNLKEAALTMQQGGGIGYDFSTLRYKGAPVHGVAADASGPLTFMDVWDAMCRTVMSAGSRRGAMMATLRCDHPDIEEFVTAKHDPARLRMFNVSVLVTDLFMEAVKNDLDWHLTWQGQKIKTIRARELWDTIMQSTYDSAEPGVIFIDRVNADNNLNYMEQIAATNPCGEQPLPPYGACLLGSINLAKMVVNAYQPNAALDGELLGHTVQMAVRMMDNVNDVSLFPLPEQLEQAKAKRRIGLGITGLADALLMLGLRYGSEEAAQRTEKWMKLIAEIAYDYGIELAIEKGPFPALNREDYVNGDNFAARILTGKQKAKVMAHGIRNSHYLSIAPTGTISLYAGNLSSGIEPIFAAAYNRKTLQKDGSKIEQRVVDYAVAEWEKFALKRDAAGMLGDPQEAGYDPGLPPAYVDAQTLTPSEHVRMQAAVQPWVDTSISKTINIPADADFETFKAVYMEAYEQGCKGCTTYRPNDITGSVISVEEKPKEDVVEVTGTAELTSVDTEALAAFMAKPEKRPEVLPGQVYKIKLGDSHAIYVTITDIETGGQRRPFEIFISTSNPEHFEWTTAMTRMISAIFRRPHDSTFIVDELKQVFSPQGGGYWKGRYWNSTVAAIGQVVEQHMKSIGYMQDESPVATLREIAVDIAEEHGLEVDHETFDRAEVQMGEQVMPVALVEEGIAEGRVSHAHPNPQSKPREVIKNPGTPVCPKCFSTNLKNENGCKVCLDCGHSKCG